MELSFPVALAGLAALTTGGIAGAVLLGQPWLALGVLGLVGILAALFLIQYSRRPGPEDETEEEAGDLEPFVDPVEEADRAEASALEPDPTTIPSPGSEAPAQEPPEAP